MIDLFNNRETYKGLIRSLQPNQIFVFGSNTQGRHELGVAKMALQKFGAKYGKIAQNRIRYG